ncbi:MAG: L,D-transpeptidase family protein [Gammaproteobacteria bacterium]|nr:L,D-transpeptidase family protein [Gammaproteobacteria bacterium]
MRKKQLIAVAIILIMSAVRPVTADAISEALSDRMDELLFGGDLEISAAGIGGREVLPDIYASRNFEPLWTADARIQELLAMLETAPEHGLDPDDYYVAQIRSLVARRQLSDSALDVADLDILLTAALVRFGYHQLFGKVNPASLDSNINFRREFLNEEGPVKAIPALIASAEPFEDQLNQAIPRGPVYRAIQQSLADYRAIAAAGGWPAVPAGATLHRDDRDPRVADLRRRLAVTDDLPAEADVASDVFDEDVEAGVIAFQERHGLDADGVVGAQSYRALNVPVQNRINQIRLSLERLRWVQEELGEQFVVVNIAGFRIFVIRNQQFVWESRVMVGKPYRQTPVFRGDIRYMELNPTWTVPPTILRKDILPAVQRDPGYLAEKNISVIDRDGKIVDPATVNWQDYTRGVPYTLRQEPGPRNALGRIKFIFPNEHFVFLHDTPSRGLFDRAERTFSSGCIRVENPMTFAELLMDLDNQSDWDKAALEEALDTRQTRRIHMKTPMPVLILYLTASVDTGNRVLFMRDVYDRDAELLQALDGNVRIELPET